MAGIVAPAAATALALILPHRSPGSAASVYILGVVAAAALGGVWSGIGAAVLSFVGLNYFFAQPLHTFEVQRPDEFVSLAVFVAVAVVVGTLVATVVAERDRAERTSAEATSLAEFTGRLLSDESLERILQAAAASIAALFDLSQCRIDAEVDGEKLRVQARREPPSPDPLLREFPLEVGSAKLGGLLVERARDRGVITADERRAIAAFAGQLAMTLIRANSDAAIRAARLEAEASDMRAALFSSITHDLRTPLASITAGVSSLLDPEVIYDRAQREDLLRTSLEEANRLNRMVANLLDLARMRAGALRPTTEIMPIEDILQAVLRRMQPALEPFEVRTVIRPDVPDVALDPIQIDQALTNILENAVRFSEPGTEITISVHAWRSRVEVRIADQGPGIPPDERERVFEPFYKADRGHGRGGTGLGLAIARAVAVAHGGRVQIEGTPGGGTAIVLELPAAARSATSERPPVEVS
ncbi:MAG: ATP-binding protein [Actinomycetota bacterium]